LAQRVELASNEWIVNLTGGLKPMSIATYDFFKNRDAKLVYISNSATNTIRNLRTNEVEWTADKSTYRPTIEEFLLGYGYEFKNEQEVEQAEEKAVQYWDCARIIALHAESRSPLNTGNVRNRFSQTHRGLQKAEIERILRTNGSQVETADFCVSSEDVRDAIDSSFGLSQLRGNLSGYGYTFLTGEWLEVFFWHILNHHQNELGIYDVRLGVKAKASTSTTDNELDVVFMDGSNLSLSVIEVKSGAQDRDREGNALYKLEAIKNQFGALQVKSYFATTSEHIFDTASSNETAEGRKLKDNVADRLGIYRCTLFTKEDIRRLAQNWMNIEYVRDLLSRKPPQPNL
jgi:hypothetical protein